MLEDAREQDDPVLVAQAIQLALGAHADAFEGRLSRERNAASDAIAASLIAQVRATAAFEKPSPLGMQFVRLCEAEFARLHDRDSVELWCDIADAAHAVGRLFDEAYARYRGGMRALSHSTARCPPTTDRACRAPSLIASSTSPSR